MKKHLGRSMPARLALDLREAGEPVAVPVMGMGVIESNDADDDERVANGYEELLVDDDPAGAVCEFYADEVEAHPWMAEPLKPVLDLFGTPTEDLQDKVRLVARVMRSQSIRGCEEWAEVDLLGRVVMEMHHMTNRRKGIPGYTVTMNGTATSALEDDAEYVAQIGTMTDLWAGSGMRAIGVATAMRMIGKDPELVGWTLYDADPMMRMIIAINCRAFDMGEKITIGDGTHYKQALLAADAAGMAGLMFPTVDSEALAAVPDDVRSMVRDG